MPAAGATWPVCMWTSENATRSVSGSMQSVSWSIGTSVMVAPCCSATRRGNSSDVNSFSAGRNSRVRPKARSDSADPDGRGRQEGNVRRVDADDRSEVTSRNFCHDVPVLDPTGRSCFPRRQGMPHRGSRGKRRQAVRGGVEIRETLGRSKQKRGITAHPADPMDPQGRPRPAKDRDPCRELSITRQRCTSTRTASTSIASPSVRPPLNLVRALAEPVSLGAFMPTGRAPGGTGDGRAFERCIERHLAALVCGPWTCSRASARWAAA